jgi:uncharacterized protein YjeT (DUF2065 family)
MIWEIVLMVIGVLVVLEGLFIAIWPGTTFSLMKRFCKNPKKIREFGIVEFLLGLVILVVVYFL